MNEEWRRVKYPHMGPVETSIWDTFLLLMPLKPIDIKYDVRVGPGYVPKGLVGETLRKMAKALTQLRIDAVVETEDEIWIMEVKPRAGKTALGQLLSYAYWYEHDYKPKKPIRLGIVCRTVDPNVERLFELRGIQIFKV